MRTRHRIPSVFNLSMVDVLCCALGCVIFLWLLKTREATDQARQADTTAHQLAKSRDRIAALNKDLEALRALHGRTKDTLALRVKDNQALTSRLADLQALQATTADKLAKGLERNRLLDRDLADLRAKKAAADADLARLAKDMSAREKANLDLAGQLAALKKLQASTAADLAKRREEKDLLEKDVQGLKKLNTAAADELARRLKDLRRLEDLIAAVRTKNGEADASIARLTKDLAGRQQDQRDMAEHLAKLLALQARTTAALTRRTGEKRKLEEVLDDLKTTHEKTETKLAKLTEEQRDLLKALAALKTQNTETKDDLRKKTLEVRDLEAALASLKSLKATADKRLTDSEAAAKRLRDLLADSEARAATLEKDVADRVKALAAADRTLAETRKKYFRQFSDLRVTINDLERDKRRLAGKITRFEELAEKRFAGIAMTGRRVIFLVDMSGSMELVDAKTAAPEKWAGVRTTLAKILGSLPDLEKFQVICFSDKLAYPLGGRGRWLDFDPRTSVAAVKRELAAIKPRGGTDMYAAFAAAFGYREAGLDTIYVLSDGLPNLGAGLTAAQARRLSEREQEEILSRHIRTKLRFSWNWARGGKKVRINTVGFFYESPQVGAFLWALARENDGSFVGMSKP